MSSVLPSPTVEPIICQPWCRHGDGHPDEKVREDQWCLGVEHRVLLSTEPTELQSGGSTEQHLTTYLSRHANDTSARVFIGHGEGPGRSATLEEARRFALEILARVDGHEA
ncbi:MAG: hypothetical protein ABI903_09950 [Actinomycetota bacterium]